MSAYVISEVRPLDAELVERYRTLAAASVAQYGGRYLVRGGDLTAVEGEWPDGFSVIVLEFPSMEAARRWYDSPEYGEALRVRRAGALERRLVFVEGHDDSGS
ncbi:MAG: DUF1330 domain-containing protein [Actinocatenispora sp.]